MVDMVQRVLRGGPAGLLFASASAYDTCEEALRAECGEDCFSTQARALWPVELHRWAAAPWAVG